MKRINISFYILILSALMVSSIIIAFLYPLFTYQTLLFCQKFISHIMFELPRSLPNVAVTVAGVIFLTGFVSFFMQLIKTHVFLKKLLIKKVNTSLHLEKVLEKLCIRKKVILVKDRNLFSFTSGIFSPFIMISTGLVNSLANKELEAVLLHEESHLLSRDPLKVLLGKTFSSMFFFLPLFADLCKNIEAINEMLADQWTISRQGSAIFLRSALKKILATPELNLSVASNVSGSDDLEIRIHRLINPGTKHEFRFSRSSLVTTFLFILLSWFLLQTPLSTFHTDLKSDPASFLCSINQSCTDKCQKCNIKR